MLYTKQDLINSIIGHGTTGQRMFTDIDQKTLDKVNKKIVDKMKAKSEAEIVDQFERQNGIKLKTFAPGMYFIKSDCKEYSCQIIKQKL